MSASGVESGAESSPQISEKEYFEQRLDDQIDWYDRKSSANQKAYKRLRLVEIVVAGTIPLLAISGNSKDSEVIAYVVAICGLIVAAIAGIVSLHRFHENWSEYRASAESLKQEKYLYLARAAPYDGDRPFELLVGRVEALLKQETTAWTQAMRAGGKADKAEREKGGGPGG